MDAVELEPIKKLTRDLKKSAVTLSHDEARFLVDFYYQMQKNRIRATHQVRVLEEAGDPHEVLGWLYANCDALERNIKNALDAYTNAHQVGVWSKSIVGIGPIISAGLLAHIDITKAPTAGNVWSFAGLNPTVEWKKGEKRPWNADLKTLMWKIGESFVKVSGNEKDVYGKIYVTKRAEEQRRSDSGSLADQAEAKLKKFKIGKTTDAYKAYSQGLLPPAHLYARAKRFTVKLFISHWHTVAYYAHFKTMPPKPYVLEHLGHAHAIAPPNMELIPGLTEAWVKSGLPID